MMIRAKILTQHLGVAAAAAIALGLSLNHAAALSAGGEGKKPQAQRAAHWALHHGSGEADRRAMAHRSGQSARDHGTPAFYAAPPAFYRWPGYTHVPRGANVDEACNLPTSACPNEMRDIR
jgi:hypothetical protein